MESIGVDFLNKVHGWLYGQKLLTIQEVENTITKMVQSILANLKRIEVTMQVLVILGTKIMTSFGQNNHTQVGQKTQQLLRMGLTITYPSVTDDGQGPGCLYL